MSYLVRDIMTPDVCTIDYSATVIEATKIMASDEQYPGYVIVLRKGKPVGIVTERDIIECLAEDRDLSKTMISDVMSTPLRTIDPDDEVSRASALLSEHNIRKLVVVRDEIIYGIITAKCISQHLRDYVDRSTRDIIRWTAHTDIY